MRERAVAPSGGAVLLWPCEIWSGVRTKHEHDGVRFQGSIESEYISESRNQGQYI